MNKKDKVETEQIKNMIDDQDVDNILDDVPEYNIISRYSEVVGDYDKETRIEKRQFFEDKILPHVSKIKHLCETNGVPFYMTFCIENIPGEKTSYYSDGFIPEANGITLKDNRFIKHVNIDTGLN